MNRPTVIATHNGAFHADDVFGLAVLRQLLPDAKVVRTRDAQFIASADFAVDVGGIWDESIGRFDHHQKGFAGARDNGTVYASAGLVWRSHGRRYVKAVQPSLEEPLVELVWAAVDRELVEHIDRADTGADRGAPDYFGLSMLLDTFNLTRAEESAFQALPASQRREAAAAARKEQFLRAIQAVQDVLRRLVAHTAARFEDQALVRSAERMDNGRILLLTESGLAWEPVVVQEMPDVLFVVYPDSSDQQFQVRTVPSALGSFKARKDLPAAWAGLRDADLAAVTGLADAVFCHNARFIGGTGSKDTALAMARMALAA